MNEPTLTKQEFLAIISHDLRTPIRQLSQFSSMLAGTIENLSEQQQQLIGFIESSSNSCCEIMDALDRLTQIKPAQADSQPVDIVGIFKAALGNKGKQTDYTPHTCVVDKHTDLPVMNHAHAKTLIDCIVDNAIKFRHSERNLMLNFSTSSDHDYYSFELSDNGSGIAEHFVEHCKAVFKKYDKSSAGAGIGLTIADHIVDLYNGSLSIQNNAKSVGAVVKVSIPFAKNQKITSKALLNTG